MTLVSGILLLFSPFIVITIFIIISDGWKMALSVWGIFLAMIIPTILGLYLLTIS